MRIVCLLIAGTLIGAIVAVVLIPVMGSRTYDREGLSIVLGRIDISIARYVHEKGRMPCQVEDILPFLEQDFLGAKCKLQPCQNGDYLLEIAYGKLVHRVQIRYMEPRKNTSDFHARLIDADDYVELPVWQQ